MVIADSTGRRQLFDELEVGVIDAVALAIGSMIHHGFDCRAVDDDGEVHVFDRCAIARMHIHEPRNADETRTRFADVVRVTQHVEDGPVNCAVLQRDVTIGNRVRGPVAFDRRPEHRFIGCSLQGQAGTDYQQQKRSQHDSQSSEKMSSIRAITSGVNLSTNSSARMFSCSCSRRVAPVMTELT